MSCNPLALIILDGFGLGEPGPGNAITAADTPNLDAAFDAWPTSKLIASGEAVGLPEGQMGNSEVGHLNIGAGRVVYQELTRISRAIADGTFYENPTLVDAVDTAVAAGRRVHFMGLLSDGGVHSHRDHLYALLELARRRGATDVCVHCFLDGRDVSPTSGAGFLGDLRAHLDKLGVGRIATVMGRYYAMDRDSRWERVHRAWSAMVDGVGATELDPVAAVERSYLDGITDEFVVPFIVGDGEFGTCEVRDGDALVFFNFRPDRAREITRVFVDQSFVGFERERQVRPRFVCLTEYDPEIPASVAFPKDLPCCVLADVLAESGLRQLHIAETEKYAHVTFFLNGGKEIPKSGEERVLVPSPKVATYDLQPAMSAPEVTDKLVEAIDAECADVYIVNFANCDMVGHTGVFPAAVEAVEVVDACVGRILRALARRQGCAVITADHGNAERMISDDGKGPFTAHTLSDVPFCVMADGVTAVRDGILADVAPTVVALLGIAQPEEWTGESLLIY